MAIRKIINAPAIANDDTSMPKMPRRGLPINKKARKIKSETNVTFAALILPAFDLISIIIGIEPGMSMMAKRTMNAASISIKLKCIACYLKCKDKKIPPSSASWRRKGE
jgi:hypothetical protein